jgi:hypothetical protein
MCKKDEMHPAQPPQGDFVWARCVHAGPPPHSASGASRQRRRSNQRSTEEARGASRKRGAHQTSHDVLERSDVMDDVMDFVAFARLLSLE